MSVYGEIGGFESDIRNVMHVGTLETLDSEPEIESVVTGIDLDYSVVGPEYGADVPDIEDGIENGEYELGEDDETLAVAGHELSAEEFTVERERQFTGGGEMLETDSALVIVRE